MSMLNQSMYWGWTCVCAQSKYKFMLKVIIFYPISGKSSIENSISLFEGRPGIWEITRFSKHSTTAWWVDNQSIPKMASKSCICNNIKSATRSLLAILITQLRYTHWAHNITPEGVDTHSSQSNNSRLMCNISAKAGDIKECEEPESNKTWVALEQILRIPDTTSGVACASHSVRAKNLPWTIGFFCPLPVMEFPLLELFGQSNLIKWLGFSQWKHVRLAVRHSSGWSLPHCAHFSTSLGGYWMVFFLEELRDGFPFQGWLNFTVLPLFYSNAALIFVCS